MAGMAGPARALAPAADAQAARTWRAALTEWFSLSGLLYGAVNSVIALPVLYGYAAIIFGSPVFRAFLPSLSKLVLFSSVVHQVAFSLCSSLPYAIGQVQDAGLIFLSRITADIATRMQPDGQPGAADAAVVSTAIVTLGIATATLGVCLVAIGRAKLARYVSYIPMPVIGGYLAFIGLFCLEAGFSLCTQQVINGIGTWHVLLESHNAIVSLPGLLSGVLLCVVARYCTHWAALPAAMIAIPLSFYVALVFSGSTLEQARDFGWVGETHSPAHWYQVFDLFDFDVVDWSVLPYQVPVWVAMVIVVAFSSTLDVCAIEMDMGSPLDTDHELMTVGISNVLSGCLGGFTGSYIFSQTIFTYRTRVHLRMIGWMVAISEFAVFMIDIDPLTYVPLFFFAATLIFIGVDLMVEWLWEVRLKLMLREYVILLATFVIINIVGINGGLVAGVVLATIDFVVGYANSTLLQKVSKRSRIVRHPRQEAWLRTTSSQIITLQLHGNVFFGSGMTVLRELLEFSGLSGGTQGTKEAVGSRSSSRGITPATSHNSLLMDASPRGIAAGVTAGMAVNEEKVQPARSYQGAVAGVRSPSSEAIPAPNPLSHRLHAPQSVDADDEAEDQPLPYRQRKRLSSRDPTLPSSELGQEAQHVDTAANSDGAPSSWGLGGSWDWDWFASAGKYVYKSVLSQDDNEEADSDGSVDGGGDRGRRHSHQRRHRPKRPSSSFSRGEHDETTRLGAAASYGSVNDDKGGRAGGEEAHLTVRVDDTDDALDDRASDGISSLSESSPERGRGPIVAQQPNGDHGPGRDVDVEGAVGMQGSKGDEASDGLESSSQFGVKFVVLDFEMVTGIDASAARSCFLVFKNRCEMNGVKIAFAGCNTRVEFLLSAHGCVDGEDYRCFHDLYAALDWCESSLIQGSSTDQQHGITGFQLLQKYSSLRGQRQVTMVQILATLAGPSGLAVADSMSMSMSSPGLAPRSQERFVNITQYHKLLPVNRGEYVFMSGEPSASFFAILSGEIALEADVESTLRSPGHMVQSPGSINNIHSESGGRGGGDGSRHATGAAGASSPMSGSRRRTELLIHPGSFFGFVDFQLGQPRRLYARAITDCTLAYFTQTDVTRMRDRDPNLLSILFSVMLKQASVELSNSFRA